MGDQRDSRDREVDADDALDPSGYTGSALMLALVGWLPGHRVLDITCYHVAIAWLMTCNLLPILREAWRRGAETAEPDIKIWFGTGA